MWERTRATAAGKKCSNATQTIARMARASGTALRHHRVAALAPAAMQLAA